MTRPTLPSNLQKVKVVATNVEQDARGIKAEFDSLLEIAMTTANENREKEEEKIMGK
jgi:hypothetical protein